MEANSITKFRVQYNPPFRTHISPPLVGGVGRGMLLLRWIKTRITLLLIISICFLIPTDGHARETDSLVEAEGVAPISEDMGLTRDIALLRAKQAALEHVGIGLKRETIVDMGFLLDDIVKIQTFGLVKAYEIISGGREGNQYRVKIKAWVVPKEEEKPVMKSLFAHRSFEVQAKGEGSQLIKKGLLPRLTKAGYFIFDPGFSKWDCDYNITIESKIQFSQKNYEIESYYSDCQIRLVRRSNGELLILETEPEDNRIYGLNINQAMGSKGPNSFFKKIAEPMANEFMQHLNAKAGVKEHDIDIVITSLPDHRTFREGFCRMLRYLRLGIKDVFRETYDNGTGRVTVRYAEKTDYLAAMIGFRSQYKVEKTTWDRINVIYHDG